jgi:hypothetical protein
VDDPRASSGAEGHWFESSIARNSKGLCSRIISADPCPHFCPQLLGGTRQHRGRLAFAARRSSSTCPCV